MKRCVGFVVLCLLVVGASFGQVPQPPKPVSPPNQEAAPTTPAQKLTHELTAADVEAFLDGLVPLQIRESDIAGVTIAVVKDGKVLFAQGYGYSDGEKKKLVLADETMFRCGSISKLFTWTSVMQLFEQGKLDLDRDVNEYLDFKIPETFGRAITLKNLLTHTPGFEEQVKELFWPGPGSPNLGSYLKTHVPRQIFPPGTIPAYSNYGASLAGYIVERVAGIPFEQYVDENIFKPLGMEHSTFVQPLPPRLEPFMSQGYMRGSEEAKPFELVGAFPAGSMSVSAADMTHFMIAHLQDGQYGGARILKPETARLMHSRLFGLDPATNWMAYGFYEESRNGMRIIGHGGDTVAFHSDLHLLLDRGVGFFVSYNSAGKGENSPRSALWERFLERYFPYQEADAPALPSARQDAQKVAGSYMTSRRSQTSFLKLLYLLQQVTVSAHDDGTIELAGSKELNGKPKQWREVAPMKFRDLNGQDALIFKPGEDGRLELLLPFPILIGQRAPASQSQSLLLPVAGISFLIMLLTLLFWPIAALVRRHYGRRLELTRAERIVRWVVRIVCAFELLCPIALICLLLYALEHLWILNGRLDKWIYLIEAVGVIGAVGSLVVFYDAIRAWRDPKRRFWRRIHATLLALACVGFLWLAIAGNLLNFNAHF